MNFVGHRTRREESFYTFDLHPDGKRFAVLKAPPGAGERTPLDKVTFIFNFFDELRRKVPTGKNEARISGKILLVNTSPGA